MGELPSAIVTDAQSIYARGELHKVGLLGYFDLIIVSGFNVFPNEVEAIAAACTGVAECACVGRPDEKTGEAVRLFVAKVPGAALSEADLIAHCRCQLAAYKVPKEVRFLDALPKSNVGKILRKDLRGLP